MILPKSLLEQISYYETVCITDIFGYTTKTTLYFKKWYKFRKVFKHKWDIVSCEGSKSTWKPCLDDAELRAQLLVYFGG